MVAEGFDTALVILAGVALRKARRHAHRAHSPGHRHYIPFEQSAFLYIPEFSIIIVINPPSLAAALNACTHLYGNLEHSLPALVSEYGFVCRVSFPTEITQ